MTDTINIAPDDDGYAAIAATFCRSVVDDVRANRKADAAAMLTQVVEIAFYLGSRSPKMELLRAGELRDSITARIR